ncbi:MAG: glycosyltransferase [Desulfomonile tiedjei]|nr:glycosyltransferase [Desulfomonile tiedjei]
MKDALEGFDGFVLKKIATDVIQVRTEKGGFLTVMGARGFGEKNFDMAHAKEAALAFSDPPEWKARQVSRMSKKVPTISIITASLNAGSTMRHCVQSVRNQNCSAEHIIVDRDSRDETVAVAEKYARPDALIVSEQHKGLYEAINKGISIATGDIVGTLHAEAFYPHNKTLSIVQEVFKDPEVKACYGDLAYIDKNDSSRVVRYWKSTSYRDNLMDSGWVPPHPTFFVRRSVYEDHGAFRLDVGHAADYEFLLRVLLVYRIRVAYIPTLITVMRGGGASSPTPQAYLSAKRMDRKAWMVNGLQPKPWTLPAKTIRKSTQGLLRKVYSKPWLDQGYLEGDPLETREKEAESPETTDPVRGNSAHRVTTREGARPPFYVVTVNYNHENQIDRLLQSLRWVDGLKKLIIVDHSGSDRLQELKADFPILVIRQENRGYGAGLNTGLRQLPDQDALVMLCNPDTAILNQEKLADVLDYMIHNPKVGCVIPKLVTRRGKTEPSARKFYTLSSLLWVRTTWVVKKRPEFLQEHYYSEEDGPGPYEIDWGSGSAMFVRNSLFPYPISFDERFFLYFEDVDLCAQMWRHGFSVVHHPELVVYHHAARLSRKSFYYFAVHLASLLKFIKKYRGLYHRTARLAPADKTQKDFARIQ